MGDGKTLRFSDNQAIVHAIPWLEDEIIGQIFYTEEEIGADYIYLDVAPTPWNIKMIPKTEIEL
jgi:hypothetical protein